MRKEVWLVPMGEQEFEAFERIIGAAILVHGLGKMIGQDAVELAQALDVLGRFGHPHRFGFARDGVTRTTIEVPDPVIEPVEVTA